MKPKPSTKQKSGNGIKRNVSGILTIKQVAAKYGEKVKCMFYDYDDVWKGRTITVNANFLKDMEQGAIKDCH